MKPMSFLAGLAAGILLTRSMAARAVPAQSPDQPAAAGPGPAVSQAGLGGAPAHGGEDDGTLETTPRSDQELREHIRSQFARTRSQPDGIEVEVQDGCVTLRGRAQARESILLMNEVQNTAGVRDVRNELELQGSLADVLPAHGQPARRAAEEASSHMS